MKKYETDRVIARCQSVVTVAVNNREQHKQTLAATLEPGPCPENIPHPPSLLLRNLLTGGLGPRFFLKKIEKLCRDTLKQSTKREEADASLT